MEEAPPILIAAPVRDREKHLPRYLECLQSLRYPREALGFYFLVNDTSDSSLEILLDFRERKGATYRSFTVETLNLGTPKDKREGKVRPKVYHALAKLRNRILQYFGDSDYPYLFSVDSDIYVKPQILWRLLLHRKDFVAALISNLPKRMCPNAMVRVAGSLTRFKIPEGDPGLHEVTVTGAVCLMSRKVLGSEYAWSSNGEDLPFCESLRGRGIEVYLDTAPVAEHDMQKEE